MHGEREACANACRGCYSVSRKVGDLDDNAEACAETKANPHLMWFRAYRVDLQREPCCATSRSPCAIKESTLVRMQFVGFEEDGHGASQDID